MGIWGAAFPFGIWGMSFVSGLLLGIVTPKAFWRRIPHATSLILLHRELRTLCIGHFRLSLGIVSRPFLLLG